MSFYNVTSFKNLKPVWNLSFQLQPSQDMEELSRFLGFPFTLHGFRLTIILGVVLSRKNSSSSSSDDIISGDPSQFTKDSSLKRSFWGIAYTPEGTLYPDCGAKLFLDIADVVTDIQLLSQLTTRIRVYGADCNTTALVVSWTWNFFETIDVALAKSLSNDPEMSIAETGWPTNSRHHMT
ncbi:hypothetical protein DFJ43DRAFT_1037041 [Lentinula guzmanii]|uniref:glucan endo-1,3-beta-D-glucosidase n=1 Tax=Lentinula guzmanii TaxID=2804957 RepID=A0AA38JF04_9AGAR|nr:hypothetical protein DFJ43DRAFT_1041630 [Lentinula guzmanii]KAJ3735576.1 hypothetical protein DFJ43DRAFT_1037041 [Lentinula guzmanii]